LKKKSKSKTPVFFEAIKKISFEDRRKGGGGGGGGGRRRRRRRNILKQTIQSIDRHSNNGLCIQDKRIPPLC
jgi:hypothetical protein